MSFCSCCPGQEANATSLAKSKSLMIVWHTLVLVLSLDKLNSFPSDLVRTKTPSTDVPKACFSMMAKKMPKSVGESTHPCFTPLQMVRAPKVAPSNCTTLVTVTLSSFGGHPILVKKKRPSQLTRLKALVGLMNAT